MPYCSMVFRVALHCRKCVSQRCLFIAAYLSHLPPLGEGPKLCATSTHRDAQRALSSRRARPPKLNRVGALVQGRSPVRTLVRKHLHIRALLCASLVCAPGVRVFGGSCRKLARWVQAMTTVSEALASRSTDMSNLGVGRPEQTHSVLRFFHLCNLP